LKEDTDEVEGMYSDKHLLLEVDQIVFNVKTEAIAWLRSVTGQFEDCSEKIVKSKKSSRSSKSSKSSNDSKSSSSSGSSNGSKSSRKSIKDRLIMEAAKVASLKAEASFEENLTQLKRDREIAKREAKMKVYENFVEEEETKDRYEILPSNTLQTNQVPQLNAISSGASLHATAGLVNARTTVDNTFYCNQSSEVPESTENNRSLSSTVVSLLKIQAAPDVTIDTFNGDCLEFNLIHDNLRRCN
ncbi:MAG: hypothetical protein AAFY76_19490, partial [Cyanobacteria bacterium J06649_11]